MFDKIMDAEFAVPVVILALLVVSATRRNLFGIQRITG